MRTRYWMIGMGLGLMGLAVGGIAVRAGHLPPDPEEHEALNATINASSGSCGVERWSVKTGTDADKGLVNLNSSSATTIATLRGLTAPATPPANNRVQPTETTQWVVSATLTEYKLETDSDYHLVIKDASGNTMIAEIPDPACVGSGSPFTSGIQVARTEFDNKYSATTSFKTANIPVCLKGIGFFDFQHGQTGVAPNAIELHPVLDVKFNPTSCSASGGGGNGVPTASNGAVTTTAGTAVNGTLSASDTDGDSLTFAVVANPAHGTVTIVNAATGAFTYTPASGFTGSDSFTFHATDSASQVSNTATESVTVNSAGGGGTTALSNGVPATGLSGAVGAQLEYSLAVPSGATGLKFVTSGGTGDADLYVRFGSAPTTSTYDCRSINSGTNAETCSIATAQSGTYYVMVYGYAAFSGLSLTGSYTAGGGGGSQLIGDPGFEGGSSNVAPWTISSGVVSNSSSEPPHAGTWDAWMDGYGSTHTDTASQQAAIPSTVTSATLSLWLHIDTAETGTTAYDKLTVALYNTSGTLLKTLATYSNVNAASGYQQHSFDLSAYKGQTVVVKFTGTEDTTLQTSFVLDDVDLNTQ